MPKATKTRIKAIIQRTYNVKSFRVELPEGIEPDFKAGQFLQVTLSKDKQLKRYLSISSSPTEKSYIEFTKKLTESDFSTALDKLKIGDFVTIEYPFGDFTLKEGFKKIAFLSGGIGITPIRSICKYITDRKLDMDAVLLYANNSSRDIAFKEDFDLMQKEHPKLKVMHVLCEVSSAVRCVEGRINSEIIRNEIPDFLERKFYLCGPPGMVQAINKILSEELGLPRDKITTENFQGY